MIKIKDIDTRYTQRVFNDTCLPMRMTSDMRDSGRYAVSHDMYREKICEVRVSVAMRVSANISSEDEERLEGHMMQKIMHFVYGDIERQLHEVLMSLEYDGMREDAIKGIKALLKEIKDEQT